MFFTTLSGDDEGNDVVTIHISGNLNLAALMAAIENPDLSDEIDEAIEEGRNVVTTMILIEDEPHEPFDGVGGWSTEDIPPENVFISEDLPRVWTLEDDGMTCYIFIPVIALDEADQEEELPPPSEPFFRQNDEREDAVYNEEWAPVSTNDLMTDDETDSIDPADLEWWSEEELNAILIPVEEDEEPNELADLDVDLTKNDAPDPKKGQRISDRGWKSKRQWQKGRDNRLSRHEARAGLNSIVRRQGA